MMAYVAGQVNNEGRETTRRSAERVGWDRLEEGLSAALKSCGTGRGTSQTLCRSPSFPSIPCCVPEQVLAA